MVFDEARDLMQSGSFEVAGDMLKEFLGLNPTDQDYLDIEAKYGPTTFLKLRTVRRWYDDPKRNDAFKKDVLEKIVDASIKASETLLKNPARIARFVRNLGGIPEEYGFAIQELKRSGDAVVPQLIEAYKLDSDERIRAGILRAVIELGPETIPGLLAAAEGMKDEFRRPLIEALIRRPDLLVLSTSTDTNVIPLLWFLASSNAEPDSLKELSAAKLRELYATAYDRRKAEEELTRAAVPLYDRTAKFQAGDPATKRVRLWHFDTGTQAIKSAEVTQAFAEEAFGLKYLKWAIERNAKFEPAQDLFLAFATERAVERINFADLAAKDPNSFRLLAAAPAASLIRILENSLSTERTALVLGLVQALGDRAEPAAGNVAQKPGGGVRQPVLVSALAYKDPRVQLAAALALLKIPNAKHGAEARIVEVLARSIAPDSGAATNRGKAIVADPSTVRGDQVANLLRAIGYQVEVVGNGRQLAQRIDRTADFDLVLVDRHIVMPTLADLIPQLRASPSMAKRPLMIVASPDAHKQLGFETLLTKMAALIAASETAQVEVPGIPEVDRRKPIDEIERNRKAVVDLRDRRLREIYEVRLARLQRLVESANIRQSDELHRRLDLRLPQLTMAGLIAEYDLTPTSAPKLVSDFTQLTELIRRQTDLDASVKNVDTASFAKLVLQLESVLTPPLVKTFDTIRARLDEESLALAKEAVVDDATATALRRLVRTYPDVSVIREPYSRVGFEDDVAAAMPDAAQRPRHPEEKLAASRTAVESLLKIASGIYPGYDVRPATEALRSALLNNDLAIPAAEALSRISSANAQNDLVRTASDVSRSTAVRSHAAGSAIRSVRAFGKLLSAEVANLVAMSTTKENESVLASDLAVLNALLTGKPGDFATALKAYQPTVVTPVKPIAPKPEEKKPEEKKPEEKKDGEGK